MQHFQQGKVEHGLQGTSTSEVIAAHLWAAFEFGGRATVGRCGNPSGHRLVEVIGAILKSQRKRKVPQSGTLENPPGSETREEGPAWELPESIHGSV